MMKKNFLIICGITALMLSGCTKSTISSNVTAAPVFETQEGVILDWAQIGSDLDEQFVNSGDYPMTVSVSYNVQPDQKLLDLILMVKEGTTPEEAVSLAKAAVRAVNDEATIQDFSIEASSETSYGGFFKDYGVNITVLPDGYMEDESAWLVDMTIPAGSDQEIVPIEGAKAM